LEDLHQDHSTIAKEGLRAFKMKSILGYEIPWNNINFTTQSFIVFDKTHLVRKLNALSCYESQKHRYYASKDFITSLARTRGTQIGVKYAEVFEVIRWIL
jgi:LmbE family N-acetylglucosaminyl deacetylase